VFHHDDFKTRFGAVSVSVLRTSHHCTQRQTILEDIHIVEQRA